MGSSVVNALSDWMEVEVARDKRGHKMRFERGKPMGKLKDIGAVNRRGTTVSFHPDGQIFGRDTHFSAPRLYRMVKSKAYLFRGVEIRWKCDPSLVKGDTPAEDTLKFPGGLLDFLRSEVEEHDTVTPREFFGKLENRDGKGAVEWAVTWTPQIDPFVHSYCNTIPTPQGGTHEQGLRNALTRALRSHGERTNNRKTALITADDVMGAALRRAVGVHPRAGIPGPDQGQALHRRRAAPGSRTSCATISTTGSPRARATPTGCSTSSSISPKTASSAARRKRPSANPRRASCACPASSPTARATGSSAPRYSLVEGDSAGGSAKQARDRATQAVLPLRGKILNVASAAAGKLAQNQELSDLVQALGCGTGAKYRDEDLRYERVIIMTDADVDGAHIASLLLTFFYREMPRLIAKGHLHLAMPPLFRLSHGGTSVYARDEADRARLLKSEFKANAKVEVSRFKGLGEMMPAQLKETTMRPGHRTLVRVEIADAERANTENLVERLMGKKPELRFQFIQENAQFAAKRWMCERVGISSIHAVILRCPPKAGLEG